MVCERERADEGLGDDYEDEEQNEEEAEDETGELVDGEDEYDDEGRPMARPRRASAVQRSGGSNKTVPIPPHSSFFVLSHTNR